MEQPDEIIHQPLRLKIMSALRALPEGERIEFVRLKAIVNATEGNLGAHITTLEKAGYVKVDLSAYTNLTAFSARIAAHPTVAAAHKEMNEAA